MQELLSPWSWGASPCRPLHLGFLIEVSIHRRDGSTHGPLVTSSIPGFFPLPGGGGQQGWG